MKRAVISGFLTLVGSLWIIVVGDWTNQHLVDSARRNGGFFAETLLAHPAALLLFFGGILLLGFGLVSLMIEYFSKD